MASMIDGDSGADVTFDWDQAQRELLDEAGIDMAKEMEAKLLTVAEEAYRREKQKAEIGQSDPAETSWKLIKGLRERLQPGQVQSIVKKAGVIAQKSLNDAKSLPESQAPEQSWVTMSDVKLQAVKELCYEVALGDFDMAQSELEELSQKITRQVTQRWGKSDPCFEESWRSVLRDAAETIGLEIKEPEPKENTKENNRLKAKLDEVSRREQIKDMELAQLRAKVTAAETGTYTSHKYIRGKEFDQPSPGVIVPGHLDDEERIQWLMENDPAFRRGRLRWEKTQKKHQENLKQREVNKEKRKESQPKRTFEPLKDEPSPGVTFNQEVEVKHIAMRRSKSARRQKSPPPPTSPGGMRSDNMDPFDRSQNQRSFRNHRNNQQRRQRPKSQSAPMSRDGEGGQDRRVTYNENRRDRGRENFQRQVSTGNNGNRGGNNRGGQQQGGGSKLEQYRNRTVGGVGGANGGEKSDTHSDNRNYDQKRTPKQNRKQFDRNSPQQHSNNHHHQHQKRGKSRNRKDERAFDDDREVIVGRGDQRVESPRFNGRDNRRGARPMYQPPHRRGSEKE